MTQPGPLRVLASFPPPRASTNPYVVMLADALKGHPEIRLDTFSWRKAITRRYDVFHAHWPEALFTGSHGWKRMARRVLFLIFLILLRLRRTAVVRTMHNLSPHEDLDRTGRAILASVEDQTMHKIALNDRSAGDHHDGWTTIAHGHYVSWFADHPRDATMPGRLVFAGLIRPYKNVPALIVAFAETDDPTLSLRVVGRPVPEDLGHQVEALARHDQRISLDLRHLTDAQIVAEVTRAELVVLPYAEMHNSGAAIMALSLHRPILVPDNDVNRALADEVGAGWVLRYEGAVTPSVITSALATLRDSHRAGAPDLSARDWADTAARHLEVYRAAVASKRAPARNHRSGPA